MYHVAGNAAHPWLGGTHMRMSLTNIERPYGPKAHVLFLTVFSIAVYVGTSLAIHRLDDPSRMDADEQEYYGLAGGLIHNGYTFSLRRPPVHVLILAILRILSFDNLPATRALAAAVFSLSAPFTYILARRLTGRAAFALTIGVTTIFWPPFLYYGSTLYSETTTLPLFILTLICIPPGSLFVQSVPRRLMRTCVAGLLLGFCMLVRPMYLLFSPFAVAILFMEEQNWAAAMHRAAALAAGCLLVVLPWSAYITSKAGTPVLVSGNGGETLAGGLNPVLIEQGYQTFVTPDGRQTWLGPGKWLNSSSTGYLNKDEQKLPYAQEDALLRRRALGWVLRNPTAALRLQGAKLLYMWGVYPFWNGRVQTFFGNIPTVAFLILSILSLVRFRHYFRHLARYWVLLVFVSLVALISWGSWRFRQPGDLGLIMLGGLFLWSLLVNRKDLIASNWPRRENSRSYSN
jgi:hypothetical protein